MVHLCVWLIIIKKNHSLKTSGKKKIPENLDDGRKRIKGPLLVKNLEIQGLHRGVPEGALLMHSRGIAA